MFNKIIINETDADKDSFSDMLHFLTFRKNGTIDMKTKMIETDQSYRTKGVLQTKFRNLAKNYTIITEHQMCEKGNIRA